MASQGIVPAGGIADEADLLQGGVNELDGDRVDIDVVFANFTPDTTPPEVDDPAQLGAILKGIDNKLIVVSSTTTIAVRNETGSPIAKGTLVSVVGYSVPEGRPLIQIADKDDPAKRPTIGVLTALLPNNANADALVNGTLTGVDTSLFALTDQLVLGAAGAFSRPPADVGPTFTGEVQNVGSVTRVDGVNGEVSISLDGLEVVSASQSFALQGTFGTPSDTNRYVTATEPRLPTSDQKDALAGTSGVPSATNKYVTNADSRLVFGASYQSAVSEGESTTSLTGYQEKLKLTTPSLPAGTYMIQYQCRLKTSGANQDVLVQCQVDDTTTLGEHISLDTVYKYGVSGFASVVLTAAVHTIDLDFRAGTGPARTASIKEARIAIWRVS